ncbi:hypothetical protein XU18_4575 [Perkinsela sp. CCAP 1560/4]|nr:hypothetical protein XU18_4575 [Perkinsela sp. CCAP 1560/4]|eukprot:KNH04151.1 hypothetical protein XU18_4575 [Perkinsela sp. CCAP 1560/4]
MAIPLFPSLSHSYTFSVVSTFLVKVTPNCTVFYISSLTEKISQNSRLLSEFIIILLFAHVRIRYESAYSSVALTFGYDFFNIFFFGLLFVGGDFLFPCEGSSFDLHRPIPGNTAHNDCVVLPTLEDTIAGLGIECCHQQRYQACSP